MNYLRRFTVYIVLTNQNQVMATQNHNFAELAKTDVSPYIEKKKVGGTQLSYLSWATAWRLFKIACPDADYLVHEFNGLPYLYDPNTGYMVKVTVTANNEARTIYLPVLDGANKAMKAHPYTYNVKNYSGGTTEKSVEAATMFDINTAIMRAFVKAIAMHGLGLFIYEGEDLPKTDDNSKEETKKSKEETKSAPPRGAAQFEALLKKHNLKLADLAAPNFTDAEKATIWQAYVNTGGLHDLVRTKYPNNFEGA